MLEQVNNMTNVETKNSIIDYSKLTKKDLIALLKESDSSLKQVQDEFDKFSKHCNDTIIDKIALGGEISELRTDFLSARNTSTFYKVTTLVFGIISIYLTLFIFL